MDEEGNKKIKTISIGDPEVGKTSMLLRFCVRALGDEVATKLVLLD